MSKQLQINKNPQASQPLSKEQKRFNNYVRRIEQLRNEIEITKEQDLKLRQTGEKRVTPAEKEAIATLRELVLALDGNPHLPSLTEKQYEKFCSIISQEIERLLQTHFHHDDETLKALYEKYNPDEESWDEAMEIENEEMKDMASHFFNQMFGTNFEGSDFDDPAKMKEKIEARQAEFEAEERAREARRNQRKKTNSQLAAEAKRKAAEEAVAKTAKQIYVDLIRHFHPDKEPDEQKRLEKTEIMKQITVAYEANDHLKLLELQMTLLNERNNVFADFNESQLKYFNDVLKRQVQELEMELEMCSPDMNGNMFAMLYHPDPYIMDYRIEQHVREQKRYAKMVRNTIEGIQTVKGLKQFVKAYHIEEDSFDDIPPELLKMMGIFGR
ncbi:MAG: J domain-containing protein [Saprospiraceae bacterium]|nr:J domain-containing protein [Saprospiraceae bacterium]